jgi:hypothetical protein
MIGADHCRSVHVHAAHRPSVRQRQLAGTTERRSRCVVDRHRKISARIRCPANRYAEILKIMRTDRVAIQRYGLTHLVINDHAALNVSVRKCMRLDRRADAIEERPLIGYALGHGPRMREQQEEDWAGGSWRSIHGEILSHRGMLGARLGPSLGLSLQRMGPALGVPSSSTSPDFLPIAFENPSLAQVSRRARRNDRLAENLRDGRRILL